MVVQTSGNNFTRVNDWCYYNFAHVFNILKFEFYFKRHIFYNINSITRITIMFIKKYCVI